jgi:hypothetical protein
MHTHACMHIHRHTCIILGNNWLDMSSIIAQRSLGLLDVPLDCESRAKSLMPVFYFRQLFCSHIRPKIIVGLTDGLYAVTDGLHAQYFDHYDSVDSESVASPKVWPIEIDTSFGVAAVTYRAGSGSKERDSMGDTTTTMLGCRCTDNADLPPTRIQCALALKGLSTVSTTAYTSDISYTSDGIYSKMRGLTRVPRWPPRFRQPLMLYCSRGLRLTYMTCSMAQISVQSVRWPVTRFTGRWALTHTYIYIHTQTYVYIISTCALRSLGVCMRTMHTLL